MDARTGYLPRQDLRLILRTLVIGSVLMALMILSRGLLSNDVNAVLAAGNPITVSRIIGLGAIVLLISAITAPMPNGKRWKRPVGGSAMRPTSWE